MIFQRKNVIILSFPYKKLLGSDIYVNNIVLRRCRSEDFLYSSLSKKLDVAEILLTLANIGLTFEQTWVVGLSNDLFFRAQPETDLMLKLYGI